MIYEIIQHRVLVMEQHQVLLMVEWNIELLTTDQTD